MDLEAEGEAAVMGEMQESEDFEPLYEALSYAWGSGEKPHVIHFRDGSYARITASLHTALQHLRYTNMPRLLWADALCINQADAAEKSRQVALMGDIYRMAAQVVVWLGNSEAYDGLAFQLLDIIANASASDFSNLSAEELGNACALQARKCSCCEPIEPVDGQTIYDMAMTGLRRILDRPWFQRLWVVQEIVLASDMLFQSGTHTTYFYCLERLLAFAGYATSSAIAYSSRPDCMAHLGPSALQRLSDVVASCQASVVDTGVYEPLLNILSKTCMKSCSDPRDRIYAILGISDLIERNSIAPDYTIDVLTLFRSVTLEYIQDQEEYYYHHSLLLAAAGLSRGSKLRGQSETWPSWVPDMHALPVQYRTTTPQYDDDREGVKKRGRFPVSALHSRYTALVPNEIAFRGYICGQILDVLETSQFSIASGCIIAGRPDSPIRDVEGIQDSAKFLSWVYRCAAFIQGHDPQHESKSRASDWPLPWQQERSMLSDSTPSAEFPMGPDSASVNYSPILSRTGKIIWEEVQFYEVNDLLSAFRNMRLEYRSSWKEAQVLRMLKSFGMAGTIGEQRSLSSLKTPCGQMFGWVSDGVQHGDAVCVLHGAPFPFVLRRSSQAGAFELLGDAYFNDLDDTLVGRSDGMSTSWITLC